MKHEKSREEGGGTTPCLNQRPSSEGIETAGAGRGRRRGTRCLNQRPSSEGIETEEPELGAAPARAGRLNQRPSSEGIETRPETVPSGFDAKPSQSAP